MASHRISVDASSKPLHIALPTSSRALATALELEPIFPALVFQQAPILPTTTASIAAYRARRAQNSVLGEGEVLSHDVHPLFHPHREVILAVEEPSSSSEHLDSLPAGALARRVDASLARALDGCLAAAASTPRTLSLSSEAMYSHLDLEISHAGLRQFSMALSDSFAGKKEGVERLACWDATRARSALSLHAPAPVLADGNAGDHIFRSEDELQPMLNVGLFAASNLLLSVARHDGGTLLWVRERDILNILPPVKTCLEDGSEPDWYLLQRRGEEWKVALVLELKPFVTREFLSDAFIDEEGKGGAADHQHLCAQLFDHLCGTGAPAAIVMTGEEVVFFEVDPRGATAASPFDFTLSAHQTLFAHSASPEHDADRFSVVRNRNQVAVVTGLALLAAEAAPTRRREPFFLQAELQRLIALAAATAAAPGGLRRGPGPATGPAIGPAPGPGGTGEGSGATPGASNTAPPSHSGQTQGLATTGPPRDAALCLKHRFDPFAQGGSALAYRGCIGHAPASDTHFCIDLSYREAPCWPDLSPSICATGHTPVVVKIALGPGQMAKDKLAWLDELSEQPSPAQRLEREAATYEELQPLQGNVLPRFYGIAPGQRRGYVYQDVGIALSEILTKVLEDGAHVPRLYHTIKQHIKALHAAGYSHGDIADRNVCVTAVESTLCVRLIDLGSAQKLEAFSSSERKELEEGDFQNLREIFSLRGSDLEPPLQSDDSTEAL